MAPRMEAQEAEMEAQTPRMIQSILVYFAAAGSIGWLGRGHYSASDVEEMMLCFGFVVALVLVVRPFARKYQELPGFPSYPGNKLDPATNSAARALAPGIWDRELDG